MVEMKVRTKINEGPAVIGKSISDMMGGQRQASEQSLKDFQS